jgi:hypothetical protein
MSRKRGSASQTRKLTWDDVRSLVGSLPEVEEGTSYGTPALKVAGKLFARAHQDGEDLVVHMAIVERTRLVKSQPSIYHFTEHYRKFPFTLVRLNAVTRDEMAEILYRAWRSAAPKKVLASFDAGE